MALVKLHHGLAGPRDAYPGGHEVDFPQEVAERLVRGGYGSPVGWKLGKTQTQESETVAKK